MKRNIILGVLLLSAICVGSMWLRPVSAQDEVSETPIEDVVERPEASTTLVLSQVNGGGGGSTGTYLNDYVEIKNISSTTQSLNGLSLYYGSALGNFASLDTNAFQLPNVSIAPGKFFLVQLGSAGSAGAALPTPDATTPNLNLSGTSGKVALVTAALPINTCGATATPCSAAQLAMIVDWVAYGAAGNGTAGTGEGGTAVNNGVAITSTQGAVRKGNGCTDTDNNNNDFDVVTAPVPRNGATAASTCATGPAPRPRFLFTTRLSGANEVPTNNSTGRGYGRVVLNAAQTEITASFYWENLSSGTTAGHIHGNAAIGANAPVLFNMSPTTGLTSGATIDRVFAVTPQQVADLRAGLWYFNIHTTNFGGGEIRGQIVTTLPDAPYDLNGDGKTDFGVVRQTQGGTRFRWFNLTNTTPAVETQFDFGLGSDNIVLGDFDGDGKDDVTVWRGATDNSYYYILQSSTNTVRYVRFGQPGDYPYVSADYDGDGVDDPAVYRPGATNSAQSQFWWYGSYGVAKNVQVVVNWGIGSDTAAPGDYTGDGKADFCVLRTVGGRNVWQIHPGTGGFDAPGLTDVFARFGVPTDGVVPGDYDGDGTTDIAVIRYEAGNTVWYFIPSSGTEVKRRSQWGRNTDFEVQGDYDGDGKTDQAIWRAPANGTATFFVLRSSDGAPQFVNWGFTGDQPAAYDGHN